MCAEHRIDLERVGVSIALLAFCPNSSDQSGQPIGVTERPGIEEQCSSIGAFQQDGSTVSRVQHDQLQVGSGGRLQGDGEANGECCGEADQPQRASSRVAAGGDQEGPKLPADQAQIACDEATADLKVIKRSKRIRLRSADGTTRYMTTEEIKTRRESAEKAVSLHCA